MPLRFAPGARNAYPIPMNTTRGSWQEDPQGLHQLFCFADFDHALAFTVAVGRLGRRLRIGLAHYLCS